MSSKINTITNTEPTLAQAVEANTVRGARILDLGAGIGTRAKAFRDAGAIVTAVEKSACCDDVVGIDWRLTTVENYIEECPDTEMFDLIFIQNLIQFLPKEWVLQTLLPWAGNHTVVGGHIGIRTFTESPVPAYDQDLTYYTNKELFNALPTPQWEKITAYTVVVEAPTHKFFMLDRMVRRGSVETAS